MSAAADESLLELGHRALWLRSVLKRHGAALSPREREVLTLIALELHGVPIRRLADAGDVPGVSGPGAVRRAEQLARHGLVHVNAEGVFDLHRSVNP